MKGSTESKVLRSLFKHQGLTRTELSDLLGIRKNTIGYVCNKLLEEKKALSAEPRKKRNAKLRLNSSAFFAVGIEHTVQNLMILLVDGELNILKKCSFDMPESYGMERVNIILEFINKYMNEQKLDPEKLCGLGYSDFIPHDIGAGLKAKSIWMPNWGQINIKSILQKKFSAETFVIRSTDAYAVAEHVWGSCRQSESFILLQLADGIGLSVFLNGGFVKGPTDIFGELGHTVYDNEGEICKCGNRGCLETFAGKNAIINKVSKNLFNNTGFVKRRSRNILSFDDILSNAEQQNKLALLALSEAGTAIGDSIANVINVLGINVVVLHGETVKSGNILIQEIRNSIKKHCIYPLSMDTKVHASSLDDFSGAAGSAYQALNSYFLC